jgi:hypothetical protein
MALIRYSGKGWLKLEVGKVLNPVEDCTFEDDVPEPPAPADRVCLLCPTILSRYNTGHVCGPCERTNREFIKPLVCMGKEFDGDWLKAHQVMRDSLVGMKQRFSRRTHGRPSGD